MNSLIRTSKKFWSLEGFVAIIITIFAARALFYGSYLVGILMTIFAYWWIKRVLSKTVRPRGTCYSHRCGPRDLDL